MRKREREIERKEKSQDLQQWCCFMSFMALCGKRIEFEEE